LPTRAFLFWLLDGLLAIALAAALAVPVSLLADRVAGAELLLALTFLCIAGLARAGAQVLAADAGQNEAACARQAWRVRAFGAVLRAPAGIRVMLGEQTADATDRIEDLDGYHARLAVLVGTVPVQSRPAARLAGDQITITQSGQTLVLNRGDRLVVTGPSGYGKTSLLEAIAGQRDAACNVMIDGNFIGAIPADQRRALFALSPQSAQMIAGTIADNLGLARPGLTADDMWRSLETACLADTVRAMPEGLGT
jgi:ABC-type transport system involved in cytochrome bd biosynthesis fused ATPase/permease subunit